MEINQSEKYETIATEWQYQMIKILKEKLQHHIIDSQIAQDICGDFSFDLAMLQDQGELIAEGNEYRPVICFEDNDGQLFYNTDEQFQLHEYAYSNTSEVFDPK